MNAFVARPVGFPQPVEGWSVGHRSNFWSQTWFDAPRLWGPFLATEEGFNTFAGNTSSFPEEMPATPASLMPARASDKPTAQDEAAEIQRVPGFVTMSLLVSDMLV